MQRANPNFEVQVPNNISGAAANWLNAALTNISPFFTDPGLSASGRLFYDGFNFGSADNTTTEKAVAELNAAFSQESNTPFLNQIYAQIGSLSQGMGQGITMQNATPINEFKQAFLQSLLTNPAFKTVWDNASKVITQNIDAKLQALSQQLETLEKQQTSMTSTQFQSEKEALLSEQDNLQKQRSELLEKMQLKVLSALVYKTVSEANKSVSLHNNQQLKSQMDEVGYRSLIKVVNDFDVKELINREKKSNVDYLKQTLEFSPSIVSGLRDDDTKKLQTLVGQFESTLASLYKNIPNSNIPERPGYIRLGELGKQIANESLIAYVQQIHKTPGEAATKEAFLRQISNVIYDHLNKHIISSNDPATKKSTEELIKVIAPYLNKELKFAPETDKMTTDLRTSKALSSSTAQLFKEMPVPQVNEAQRKKLAKDVPPMMRGKITKREQPTPNLSALAPKPPTPSITATDKTHLVAEPVTPTLGKK